MACTVPNPEDLSKSGNILYLCQWRGAVSLLIFGCCRLKLLQLRVDEPTHIPHPAVTVLIYVMVAAE
jgi:hypothetical protein